ncbi:hypothetical protein AQUCO_09200017v1 [Aquilegia coerulea]|uniref:Transmembrane protein n=1 Tax=Aquilegia coerulea TaxID=218851 RepID=A0A2G5C5K2_AQUCA|nr:hypothetical protein AQUCO_09200017v1 [Aquilegia coerulea]
MACKQNASLFSYLVVLIMFLVMTQFAFAAREIPRTINSNAKNKHNQDVPLTTQTFPGFGVGYNNLPGRQYHQYIPGFDDTFIPNPGFEVPNPAAVQASAARP